MGKAFEKQGPRSKLNLSHRGQVKKKSRKFLRKEQRKAKKARRNDYFQKKKKLSSIPEAASVTCTKENVPFGTVQKGKRKGKTDVQQDDVVRKQIQEQEKEKIKRERELKKIQAQRKKQLKMANMEEDINIKRLEKQLKLNKRRSKTLPQCFSIEGLDYLLEVCDKDRFSSIARAETQLSESGSEFEEDFAIVTGKKRNRLGSESDDERDSLLNGSIEDIGKDTQEVFHESDEIIHTDEEESDVSQGNDGGVKEHFEKVKVGMQMKSASKQHTTGDSSSEPNDRQFLVEDNKVRKLKHMPENTMHDGFSDEGLVEESVVRKMKKRKLQETIHDKLSDESLVEENVVKKKKKKCKPEKTTHVELSDESLVDENVVKKKKKKCKPEKTTHVELSDESLVEENVVTKKKKKCKPGLSDESLVEEKLEAEKSVHVELSDEDLVKENMVRKKNKKKHNIENTVNELNNNSLVEENMGRNKKKKCNVDQAIHVDESLRKETKVIKKKKHNPEKTIHVESSDEGWVEETNVRKKKKHKPKETLHVESDADNITDVMDVDEESGDEEEDNKQSKKNEKYWEDIYGRLRDSEGNVVQVSEKYVPPHQRKLSVNTDSKKKAERARLKKQLKGLLNRLAESNMHSIAGQIEELYMSNSRNDMNETLTELVTESVVSSVLTPERLVMEHVLLLAVLHANVGTEVGAHFLQAIIKMFDEMYGNVDNEGKELHNIMLIVSHLYNFKVLHSVLMYNLLQKFSENFEERDIELILLVLKSVGFTLRKEDPLSLKDLILQLQRKASDAEGFKDNTRVQFMLDIVMAIKNNNMQKIPNYDPSHVEHLKKLMKTFIHKGHYITELNISLDDLLKADERGKWWLVGSAWEGAHPSKANDTTSDETKVQISSFSQQLLGLARQQRMNTDVRKAIFCILMSAEDYMDAFEKLLHLGLKNQQDREIIHVVMSCCLQESVFNPYYAYLAQKLCDFDRKYQMTIQYSLWDKLKDLHKLSSLQLTNLAQFLTHLFVEKGLPLSVLKVIHFAEMDKTLVKFLRQIMLGLLLHESEEACRQVFLRVAVPPKLHVFREGLRLFMHHFLLRNKRHLDVEHLQHRVTVAEKALTSTESRLKL